MKNYLVKENKKEFVKEYWHCEGDNGLTVKYADGYENIYIDIEKNKKYLDDKMLKQYENYKYNPIFSFHFKDLIASLPSGYILGLLATYQLISKETGLEDILTIYGITGTGLAIVITAIIAAARAEKSERDHDKDELFIKNLELIKEKLKDEQFCKKLPKKIREKVTSIKEANETLTLNTMNKFNLRQMENLVDKCHKSKVKKRDYYEFI